MILHPFWRYLLTTVLCLYLQAPAASNQNTQTIFYKPFFSIEIEALYLQPNYSLGSFTENFSSLSSDTNIADRITYHTAALALGWGSRLNLTYHYKEKSDLNLNWYQFLSSTQRDLVNGTNSLSDNIYDIISDSTFFSNVLWTLESQWNAINLEVGQELKLSLFKKSRIHAGLQATEIKTTNTTSPATPSHALEFPFPLKEISGATSQLSFKGIGPRIGIDFLYELIPHLSLTADSAASLLIGTREFKISTKGLSPQLSFPYLPALAYTSFTSSSNTVLVPELGMALGGQYTYATKFGQFSSKLGWMWVNYWSALSSPRTVTSETKTDFGVQGLYFGIKWASA